MPFSGEKSHRWCELRESRQLAVPLVNMDHRSGRGRGLRWRDPGSNIWPGHERMPHSRVCCSFPSCVESGNANCSGAGTEVRVWGHVQLGFGGQPLPQTVCTSGCQAWRALVGALRRRPWAAWSCSLSACPASCPVMLRPHRLPRNAEIKSELSTQCPTLCFTYCPY